MKKITLLLSFVACAMFAQGQKLLVENFDYTVGTGLIANSWIITGSTTTTPILITASTITYPGYLGSGIGNEIFLATSGEDLNKTFTPQTGTVYVSFLANITSAGTGDYFLNLGADVIGSGFVGRVFVKKDASDKVAFGVQMNSGGTPAPAPTYTAFDYALNTTYLIVLKHDNTGKVSSIIINPSMNTEPTIGWIENNQGTNATPLNIGAVAVRQGSTTAGVSSTLKLDGIRVATSWGALFDSSPAGLNTTKESKLELIVSGKNLLVKNLAEGSEVEIFSAVGSKVLSAAVENGKVNIANLKNGMYVVRSGKKTQKIRL